MTYAEFKAIVADIEDCLQIEAGSPLYSINVLVSSGFEFVDCAWQPLRRVPQVDIIVLSMPDRPPVYVPLRGVLAVQLCADRQQWKGMQK